MQISEHYTGFPEKTLVIILNHERARIFIGHAHTLTEEKSLKSPGETVNDLDALREFFTLVHKRMERALHKEHIEAFCVCVPEIHRPFFQECTPKSLTRHIKKIIPKNLSAMQEGSIVRIIFEG